MQAWRERVFQPDFFQLVRFESEGPRQQRPRTVNRCGDTASAVFCSSQQHVIDLVRHYPRHRNSQPAFLARPRSFAVRKKCPQLVAIHTGVGHYDAGRNQRFRQSDSPILQFDNPGATESVAGTVKCEENRTNPRPVRGFSSFRYQRRFKSIGFRMVSSSSRMLETKVGEGVESK